MRLKDKIALVTGAGQGIGRAIALTFAKEGADIIVNDVNLEQAEKVAEEVRALGRRALAVKADVSRSSDVNRMVEEALNTFKKIDILVNNAGVVKMVTSEELGEADWDWIVGVDLKGQFLCSQAVGRHMIKQKWGRIVNISSVSGRYGRPMSLAYCVSKGGVLQLTRTLAVEWAKHGINVNAVSPSLTRTPILEKAGVGAEERSRKIPQQRLNQPKDIANAVMFLVSSEAENITGQNITVDGGLCALHPGYLSELP